MKNKRIKNTSERFKLNPDEYILSRPTASMLSQEWKDNLKNFTPDFLIEREQPNQIEERESLNPPD
jgi:hypothetical protein